jgi:four helix bundle protein
MASDLSVRNESIEATVPAVSLEPPGFAVELLLTATAAEVAVAVSTASASEIAGPAHTSEVAPLSSAVVIPSDAELDVTELDASRLHCYQVALELHSLSATLVASFSTRIVKDQLERASLSVVLNIAEGGGRRARRDKARFYTIARGSATEVAALMDVLERRHLAPVAAIRNGRRLAIRVIQMLTKVDAKLRA